MRLNQFLRELPTSGVRAEKSWLASGRDLLTWARFLSERRTRSVWEAEPADVAAFHRARRLCSPEVAVSSGTWDRGIATLDKFYRWAAASGHVERPPFSYRAPRAASFLPGRRRPEPVNLAKERRGRRRRPGFLSVGDYLVFRDVGLRGRLPDGGPDPRFRGRNGLRNALFAELLVTTGLRLGEAATLLRLEIPPPGRAKSARLELAPAVCKGGRGRTAHIPARVVRAIISYADVERANALAALRPGTGADALVVGADARSCWVAVDGRRVRVGLARMTEAHRMAAVDVDRSGRRAPLALWLAEGGGPVSPRAWEAVFERACLRCRSFGFASEASPHTLRHTFAVHMLSLLIREQIASLDEVPADPATAPYRRLVGDPLQRLQRLLGHRSVATTYINLDSLADAQWVIDEAVDRRCGELGPGAGDVVA